MNECPWCDEPVTDGDQATRITIPSWGQVVLLHPACGAAFFHAGTKAKPKPVRSQATPAAPGRRSDTRRRLVLVGKGA